jgi:hypothetical protein
MGHKPHLFSYNWISNDKRYVLIYALTETEALNKLIDHFSVSVGSPVGDVIPHNIKNETLY